MNSHRRAIRRRQLLELAPEERVVYRAPRSGHMRQEMIEILGAYLLLATMLGGGLFLALKTYCSLSSPAGGQQACEAALLDDAYLYLIPLAFIWAALLADKLLSLGRRQLILTDQRILADNGSLLLQNRTRLGLYQVEFLPFDGHGIPYREKGKAREEHLAKWLDGGEAGKFIAMAKRQAYPGRHLI